MLELTTTVQQANVRMVFERVQNSYNVSHELSNKNFKIKYKYTKIEVRIISNRRAHY